MSQPAAATGAAAAAASPNSTACDGGEMWDVVIVGVGAMGVSCAYHLAKAGKKVGSNAPHDHAPLLPSSLGSEAGTSARNELMQPSYL